MLLLICVCLASLACVGCAQDPQEKIDAAANRPSDVMMQVVSIHPRAGFAGEVFLTDQPEPDQIVEARLLSEAPPLGLKSGTIVRFYLASPSAAFGPGELVHRARRVRVTRIENIREGRRFHLEPLWAKEE